MRSVIWCVMQLNEEMRQEQHMLEVLKSEKQDLENEVCRFRVMKAKLLQQIGYVGINQSIAIFNMAQVVKLLWSLREHI